MNKYELAQVNIGRIKAPLDHSSMAGFMNRLDELNALADRSPGFVWRLQTGEGNATYFRPYGHDDRILLNMSVWENIETLQHYVYHTMHAELLRQRHDWFDKFAGTYAALCGSRKAIVPASTKPKNASPTSRRMAPPSSPSPSNQLSRRTKNSRKESIGLPFNPVRHFEKPAQYNQVFLSVLCG